MPGAQLHGFLAGIGDDDRIGPEIMRVLGRRAFRHEVRLDSDFDVTGHGAVHAASLAKFVRGTNHVCAPRNRALNTVGL